MLNETLKQTVVLKMDEREAQALHGMKSYDAVRPGVSSILDMRRKFKSQPRISNADAYVHQGTRGLTYIVATANGRQSHNPDVNNDTTGETNRK